MLDISEMTQTYIQDNFSPETQQQLFAALMVLERFGVKHYEDDLESMIALEGLVDKENIRDLFQEKIARYLHSVLEEHQVFLNEDHDITLYERLEICQFLSLVQDLEDKSLLAYRLTGDDSPKSVFVSLLARYSYLDDFRAMEIIDRVGTDLIFAMKKFAEESLSEEAVLDTVQMKEWKIFDAFINGSVETLGHTLKNRGYTKITFGHLYSLEKDRIDRELLRNESTDRPKAAVDVVSLLLLCKDTYQIPLMEFDKQVSVIFSDMSIVTSIKHVVTQIFQDYENFKEAYLKKELLDKGGRNE